MGGNSYIKWLTLFKSCTIRESTNKNLTFYRNFPIITNAAKNALKTVNKSTPDSKVINIILPSDLQSIKANELSEILLYDSLLDEKLVIEFAVNPKYFKIKRKDRKFMWSSKEVLFQHPIRPRYKLLSESDNIKLFFNNTITLKSKFGNLTIQNISWPSLMVSKDCRGVAVNKSLYEKLKSTIDFQKIIAPFNDSELPIFLASSLPNNCDAIGLFPQYVEEHKKYFKDYDIFGALLKSGFCSETEYKNGQRILNKLSDKENIEIDSLVPHNITESITINDIIQYPRKSAQLKKLFRSKFPITSHDALRSMLLSNKSNISDYEVEVYKQVILFNIFIESMKLKSHSFKVNTFLQELNNCHHCIKSWDYYILENYFQLKHTPKPNTIKESIVVKKKFDAFLEKLYNYNIMMVCEQKAKKNQFHEIKTSYYGNSKKNNMNHLPRSITILSIMEDILKSLKYFGMFSPNLHRYINNNAILNENLPKKLDLGLIEKTLDNKKDIQISSNLKSGELINSLISGVLELEAFIFQSNTNKEVNYKEKLNSDSWYLVLEVRDSIGSEALDLLKYSTTISMQIKSPENNFPPLGSSICVNRIFIDSQNKLYLYQKKPSREYRYNQVTIKRNVINYSTLGKTCICVYICLPNSAFIGEYQRFTCK
ncbi:hypothetical protein TPHA_0K02320 [Tetrapisispora phaffii CBS 4417]|uniref:Uncharacterized protein n=1 Tax=Tetrapisispora phaffii (strain ATCC 24235 / CBS 4417 / NBRC 1672 / NRRL Y-8282 / UCD 70-5) TaxID=1071381 RepID=G8BZN4_TETPH|nr:hypothetical protein TPHA_0K02320 [Tetrapisispora phaffii CBS 4417]CCE65362.1 hypothetical protein TPHA_0K02320 [Tetrapisispora phaffii CBS 4417]